MIEVVTPGLLTTIQDAGRPGLAHLGVSPGGASDPVSYRIANLLVGNWLGEAALEMTLKGGTFRFAADAVVALAGADFGATIDGEPVAPWGTLRLRAGAVLALGATRAGARAYLAVRGGVDVPETLGSRSTLVAGGIGPAPLRAGDTLAIGESTPWETTLVARDPLAEESGPIRVIAGPAWERLPAETFVVTEQANRQGLRLDGPRAEWPEWRETISEGVTWGTIQLPAGGAPIVLMNEQQTTGGYPVAGVVARADLARLGRLKPRDRVSFRAIGIPEALEALCEREKQIRGAIVPALGTLTGGVRAT